MTNLFLWEEWYLWTWYLWMWYLRTLLALGSPLNTKKYWASNSVLMISYISVIGHGLMAGNIAR